ncbi:hypothetical protein [Jeotgalibacillus terrae]|uniref:YopA central domain-containing protein n=1 Tax=Jeotgalibacillus terrae TaxID=587735 RepID=A0ABW5ZLY6_9BACL|nr:hypothetical protein [Jeotgalibacillus terrae]MBM7578244.1 hypothetical protein [Jeotgalibacillus terrae]
MIEAIDSKYFSFDDRFSIYEGNFNLVSKGKTFVLKGSINFNHYPEPMIRFIGETDKEDLHSLTNEDGIMIEAPGIPPTPVSFDLVQNNQLIKGVVVSAIKDEQEVYMDSCLIHVSNFVNYLGEVVTKDNFRYRGGLHIEFGEWNLCLQLRHDYKKKKLFPNLKDSKGYAITHIIKIEKRDKSLFKKSEIIEIENLFVWVFKLCTGRHIGMPIKIGQVDNKEVYREFLVPVMSSYKAIPNWFPKQRGEVIKNLFHNFDSKFKDAFIKRIIKETIHWYVEALTTTFIENKIINSQIALEKLSFVLLTQQTPQIISKSKFDKNNFEMNLELILKELSIETSLEGKYRRFSDEFHSGPNLLVKYRNHIAHPKRDSIMNSYSGEDKAMINQLGMYYTEMLLLNLVGYQGVFSNRLKFPLWEGDYDDLPWK